jgi:hypothetical protein
MSHQQSKWQFPDDNLFSFPASNTNNNWNPQPGFGIGGSSNQRDLVSRFSFLLVIYDSILQGASVGDVHAGNSSIDRQQFMRFLSRASTDDLMRARNPSYMAVFSKLNKLQGQIDSQQYVLLLTPQYMH